MQGREDIVIYKAKTLRPITSYLGTSIAELRQESCGYILSFQIACRQTNRGREEQLIPAVIFHNWPDPSLCQPPVDNHRDK